MTSASRVYTVYRNGTSLGTTTSASFADMAAAPATDYSYTVDAVDAAGNRSARSAAASVTTPAQTGPAITLRGASFNANATATTLSIAAPAGARAGDVEVMAIAARGAPRFTAPSGWTLVRQDSNGFTMTQAMFTHVVGANEPASYTWTLSSAQSAAGGMIAYGGVRTVSPVDVAGGQANASATSVTAPSIVTSKAGERLVGFYGTGVATTLTAPAGMAERGDVASAGTYRVTLEGADANRAVPGSTGATVAKAVNAAASVGQVLALAP